jgi:hypothetical protein
MSILRLHQIEDEETLHRLIDHAAICSSVQEFEECLRAEVFDPATGYPPPRRRSRRRR